LNPLDGQGLIPEHQEFMHFTRECRSDGLEKLIRRIYNGHGFGFPFCFTKKIPKPFLVRQVITRKYGKHEVQVGQLILEF
jgi:hypothetical protein